MSNQVSSEINIAADLAKLRNEKRCLSPQELKELNTKVKTLEEIARLEDRIKAFENRKRSRSVIARLYNYSSFIRPERQLRLDQHNLEAFNRNKFSIRN